MTKIKIYYHQSTGKFDPLDSRSPFDIDGVGLEPVPYHTEFDKKEPYQLCPVWNHKVKRIYNILSPIDLDIHILSNDRVSIENVGRTPDNIHSIMDVHIDSSNTLQLEIPRFLFWTDAKNVWLEVRPHPMTSLKNNFVGMTGWWNISNWIRPVSFAMHVVDRTNLITIRRGEPVFQITFHTNNNNDTFELIKSTPSKKLVDKMIKNLQVKSVIKNQDTNALFVDSKPKCPFAFMFNKKGDS